MILSQMIFPTGEATDREILYYRGQAGPITSDGLEIRNETPIRFDTYFNALFYGAYAEYTRINQVRTCLLTTGKIRIRLFSLDNQNQEKSLIALDVSGHRTRTQLPEYTLSELPAGGALFLEVTAHSTPAWIHGGWYEAQVNCQHVRTAVIICTYRRERYVYRNLRNVRETILGNKNCPACDDIDIFVIDNGKTIQAEESPRIFVFPNKNCGGSGGFTRGLLEVYRRRDHYTHFLLMDDDISFEPETLIRTVQFLKAAEPAGSPLCIGGQMLLENDPAVQFEAGSSYIKGRLCPNGRGLDLSGREALLKNAENPPVQYNAWWYCCLPVSVIEQYGFPLPLFIKTDDVEYGLRLKERVVSINGIGVWHTAFSKKYSPYLEYYIKRNELIVSAIHGSGAGMLPSLWKLIRTSGRAWLSRDPRVIHFASRACRDFLSGPDFLLRTDGEALHVQLTAEGEKVSQNYVADLFAKSVRLLAVLLQLALRYHRVRAAYQTRWKELTGEKFWCEYLDLDWEGTETV